jgi:hypothetical protein
MTSVSVLTAEEGAPGRWGPKTRVGNKCTASQVAVRRTSPLVVTARLKSNEHSVEILGLAGPGRAAAE